MELAFETKALRAVCENSAQAEQALGSKVAAVLKRRLADLDAAPSINDLLVGGARPIQNGDRHNMLVDLCDGHHMVFAANHVKNPTTETGEPDWTRISRIKILSVGLNHD